VFGPPPRKESKIHGGRHLDACGARGTGIETVGFGGILPAECNIYIVMYIQCISDVYSMFRQRIYNGVTYLSEAGFVAVMAASTGQTEKFVINRFMTNFDTVIANFFFRILCFVFDIFVAGDFRRRYIFLFIRPCLPPHRERKEGKISRWQAFGACGARNKGSKPQVSHPSTRSVARREG